MLLEPSEDTLMARYADGDERALDELFDRLAPRVLSFLRCSHGEPERAEQLLQSTFVQLHRLRKSYPRGSSARAWILSIAAELQRKSRRRVRWRTQHAITNTAEAIERRPEAQHDRAVRAAIAGLQEVDRQLLHLHRFEGLSFAEIAQVVGVTEAAIRIRAIGSYRQLRERLLSLMSDGGRS